VQVKERIGMLVVRPAAREEAREKLTAQGFRFVIQFGLVSSGAQTDLLFAFEGMGGCCIAHPGER
jgi:hypothetical protein